MRKEPAALAVFVLGLVLASCALTLPLRAQTLERPNVVFVLLDDARYDDVEKVPRFREMMGRGTTFTNFFASTSLCCPSRATFLTGKYAHNTRFYTNTPPLGGYERWKNVGVDSRTFATRLDGAGYETGFFGKLMASYSGTRVSPGWDRFAAFQANDHSAMNVDGALRHWPAGTFMDDPAGFLAERFVRNAPAGRPLLLAYWTASPHKPYDPPPRREGMHTDAEFVDGPAFDEADVSDKPAYVRRVAPLPAEDEAEVRYSRPRRLDEMEAVADRLDGIRDALRDRGALENTYFVLTSDNGLMQGDHGMMGKDYPYDESAKLPLVVEGPGVPAGQTWDALVLNTDLAHTIARWAGTSGMPGGDGRSFSGLLDPLAGDGAYRERSAVLLAHAWDDLAPGRVAPSFHAARTKDRLYVEYKSGENELYDLTTDPYQLENVAGQRPEEEAALAARLERLKGCTGQGCRDAENAP